MHDESSILENPNQIESCLYFKNSFQFKRLSQILTINQNIVSRNLELNKKLQKYAHKSKQILDELINLRLENSILASEIINLENNKEKIQKSSHSKKSTHILNKSSIGNCIESVFDYLFVNEIK